MTANVGYTYPDILVQTKDKSVLLGFISAFEIMFDLTFLYRLIPFLFVLLSSEFRATNVEGRLGFPRRPSESTLNDSGVRLRIDLRVRQARSLAIQEVIFA